MRHSTKQTTIAVIRSIIDVKVEEMARILLCSVHAIKSLEIKGRLKLSESLAKRLVRETGISLAWLLDGKPMVRPVTESGEPFTRETFERAQSRNTRNDTPKEWKFSLRFIALACHLRDVLMRASAKGDFTLASYQTMRFLNSLALKHGAPKTGYDPEHAYRQNIWLERGEADLKAIEADLAKVKVGLKLKVSSGREPPAQPARRSSGRKKRA